MIKFYSAWFCPYAQRAWIILEYLTIPYEYVESLTVRSNQSEGAGHHGYDKLPRLLELNPKGLVPTLEFPSTTGLTEKLQRVKDSAVLTDSIDCMEFLNSFVKGGNNNNNDIIPDSSLLSDANSFNQKICSTFYKVLMRPSQEEQEEAFHVFADGIAEFMAEVNDDGYYKGSTCPTIVDFTVIPWLLRFPILTHYRPTLKLEKYLEDIPKLNSYVKRMEELPAVQKTLWKDENDLIKVYKRYADGTAKSQVGNAVRNGDNAHDV